MLLIFRPLLCTNQVLGRAWKETLIIVFILTQPPRFNDLHHSYFLLPCIIKHFLLNTCSSLEFYFRLLSYYAHMMRIKYVNLDISVTTSLLWRIHRFLGFYLWCFGLWKRPCVYYWMRFKNHMLKGD